MIVKDIKQNPIISFKKKQFASFVTSALSCTISSVLCIKSSSSVSFLTSSIMNQGFLSYRPSSSPVLTDLSSFARPFNAFKPHISLINFPFNVCFLPFYFKKHHKKVFPWLALFIECRRPLHVFICETFQRPHTNPVQFPFYAIGQIMTNNKTMFLVLFFAIIYHLRADVSSPAVDYFHILTRKCENNEWVIAGAMIRDGGP